MAQWHNMAPAISVNIGSGNGLVPCGTEPLPEPMFAYHLEDPVIFIWGQFHKRHVSRQSLKLDRKCSFRFSLKSPDEQWVNCDFLLLSVSINIDIRLHIRSTLSLNPYLTDNSCVPWTQISNVPVFTTEKARMSENNTNVFMNIHHKFVSLCHRND